MTGRPVQKVTPAQRVYQIAFGLHLKSKTDDEKAVTRTIMDRALTPMCLEAGVAPPVHKPKRDLVELLVAAYTRRPDIGPAE